MMRSCTQPSPTSHLWLALMPEPPANYSFFRPAAQPSEIISVSLKPEAALVTDSAACTSIDACL